jgi:hypothetical protein
MRWILATAVTLAPSLAAAHITLVSPAPRNSSQKSAPCGTAGGVRGTNVTTLAPGATLTLTWKETVDHPGHYRIAFDDDGQDFVRPPTANDSTMGSDPTVLMDLIPDIQGNNPAGGRTYTQDITLPNVECTNCTLQLIQVMTDASKAPYTTDDASNDVYFQCVDLVLAAGAPDPDPTDPDPTDPDPTDPDPTDPMGDLDGGGCSTGAGAGLLAAFGLVGLRRRRRK